MQSVEVTTLGACCKQAVVYSVHFLFRIELSIMSPISKFKIGLERDVTVEMQKTILAGDDECRFYIDLKNV